MAATGCGHLSAAAVGVGSGRENAVDGGASERRPWPAAVSTSGGAGGTQNGRACAQHRPAAAAAGGGSERLLRDSVRKHRQAPEATAGRRCRRRQWARWRPWRPQPHAATAAAWGSRQLRRLPAVGGDRRARGRRLRSRQRWPTRRQQAPAAAAATRGSGDRHARRPWQAVRPTGDDRGGTAAGGAKQQLGYRQR